MLPTQYELSRNFWDFTFENPEKVKPTHIAIYFFAMEHCNRLGWKEKFGLPTSMVLDAIGLKSYNTYKAHFDDLVEWGAIKVIEYSKNQYSSNIIALSNGVSKSNKALAKATKKHHESTSESTQQSTGESTGSIDKPITNNLEPITIYTPEQTQAFSFFGLWVMANAKSVAGMKEPFTISEYLKLSEDFTEPQIHEMLKKMHNYSKLKNNVSANLTFRNWAKREGWVEKSKAPKLYEPNHNC